MRTLFVLALLVSLLPAVARPAGAACTTVSTANEIDCSGSPDPCVIKKSYCVTLGATLDFGTRGVDFERGGQLDVGSGGATIKAGKVNLMANGGPCGIVGAGGDVDIESTGDVVIGRDGNDAACIDLSGDPGGSITIVADGAINVRGVLDTHSTSNVTFGGDVMLNALQITADPKAEIDVRGGDQGASGGVTFEATAGIAMAGTIHGRANTAADVELTAFGGGVDVKSATFELSGSGVEGFAGTLSIPQAAGNVDTTGATFEMTGSQGGDGGTMDLDADGSVILGGKIQMRGDASSGDAGSSGEIDVFAGGNLQITATQIDLTGAPNGGAGNAFFDADGDIVQSVMIDASGSGTFGQGGRVEFTARHNLTLAAIDVSADGGGGDIDGMGFCSLTVPAGTLLKANGPGPRATIRLASGGAPAGAGGLTVAGTLQAGQSNTLEWRFLPPNTTGASFNPPVTIQPNTLLTPCPPKCNDNMLQVEEECDGALGTCAPGQLCVACQCTSCGNGQLDQGETCDSTAPNNGNCAAGKVCSADCTTCQQCGNGIIDPGEVCDDGNTEPCVGNCAALCDRFAKVCGDGITECGEAGDDGNTQSCDGVSAACELETCGNGVPECNEQCDDGPAGSFTCSPQCTSTAPPGCGDGVLQADEGEICDDGNNVGCDGCAANCLRQDNVCGDRIVECGEQCDDGGTVPGDGCSPKCQREECGNGIIDPGEFCDAGARNGQAGAGCSTTCAPLGTCTVDSGTTECIACADYTDCSPLGACGGSICVAGTCTPTPQPNCDDANPCTADACQPARGCVHTAVADGPATGCDDGDECTDDACAAGACVNNSRPGAAGATCRLRALQRIIDSASDIPKGPKRKLRGLIKKITKKLPIAAQNGKKADRALKQVNNGLKAMMRTVTKAQRKIGPATLQGLDAAIDDLMVAVGSL